MKNLLLSFLLLLCTSVLAETASQSAFDGNCRPFITSAPHDTAPLEFLEMDMLHGIWQSKLALSNMEIIYHFNPLGRLEQTVIYADGHAATITQEWELEDQEGIIFLTIKDRDLGESISYAVEQSCEGLILTDANSFEETILYYRPKVANALLENFRHRLNGHWQHQGYPFDNADESEHTGTPEPMAEAFLDYNFNLDGTFIRWMGNSNRVLEERGFWELSADGNYLVLHFSKDGAVEEIYTSQFVKLYHLDGTQMQIEQTLTTVGKAEQLFGTQQKMLVFDKGENSF